MIMMMIRDPVYGHLQCLLSYWMYQLRSIPRKVRKVVEPSIFDGFTDTFIPWHNESIVERLLEHFLEAGAPAMKKSSR